VAFSPDGKRIVGTGWGGLVRVWDTATGAEIVSPFGQNTAYLTAYSNEPQEFLQAPYAGSVSFSPDGKRIVSSSHGTVKVWNGSELQELFTLKGHSDKVSGVAFSPDGKRILSGSLDHTVKLWDATTDQAVEMPSRPDFGDRVVTPTALSPDGKRIVTAGSDGTLKVTDAATGQQLQTLKGHALKGRASIFSLVFSPDGSRILSASGDGTLRIWNTGKGSETLSFKAGAAGPSMSSVIFSADGKRILRRSNSELKIWDAATGQEIRTLKGHGTALNNAFSPDGKWILDRSGTNLKIWDTDTGKEIQTLRGAAPVGRGFFSGWVLVAFSPDGKRIVTVPLGRGNATFWDTVTGQELLTVSKLPQSLSTAARIAFSPDGKQIVVGNMVLNARPLTPEEEAQREAAGIVRFWFTQPLFSDEVFEKIRRDETVTEEVRRRALSLAEGRRPDSWVLGSASLDLVSKPNAGHESYARALRLAEAAHRLASVEENGQYSIGQYSIAWGMAQYRMGKYQEAIPRLAGAFEQKADDVIDLYNLYGLAFLSMAQHKLGKKDEAKAALEKLRALMKRPGSEGVPSEVRGVLAEAAALIEGKPVRPNSAR
jgi:WD40 repeat protein